MLQSNERPDRRSFRAAGQILLDGLDVCSPRADTVGPSQAGGHGVSAANPFPLSVFDNVAFGPQVHGMTDQYRLRQAVEKACDADAALGRAEGPPQRRPWACRAEQQQRLCISRLLAIEPEVLLMDEPCSALDPIATGPHRGVDARTQARYTILIVTHNMQQAARISDETGFMLLGDLVEFGATQTIFQRPGDKRTEDYVTGRFG